MLLCLILMCYDLCSWPSVSYQCDKSLRTYALCLRQHITCTHTAMPGPVYNVCTIWESICFIDLFSPRCFFVNGWLPRRDKIDFECLGKWERFKLCNTVVVFVVFVGGVCQPCRLCAQSLHNNGMGRRTYGRKFPRVCEEERTRLFDEISAGTWKGTNARLFDDVGIWLQDIDMLISLIANR